MTETYHRARQCILSRIISPFTKWGPETYQPPIPGDLVVITSAMPSKWYLSWVVSTSREGLGKHVLRSIEDGTLCNWSNIGFYVIPREEICESWKWTDRQFQFDDRWQRARNRFGEYWLRVGPTTFDGFSVTIRTRGAFGDFKGYEDEETFPDFRKVKVSQMKELLARAKARQDANAAKPKPPQRNPTTLKDAIL